MAITLPWHRERQLVLADDIAREAQHVLESVHGPGARFRDGQLEAIAALVERRARLLVIQRTGWGKSSVYFTATQLLRERGCGPTVIVSPLLALIRNQVEAAERFGLRAVSVDSSSDAWAEHGRLALARDELDVLLIAPERLASTRFRNEAQALFDGGIGMLVVDEAHCISDWGHDFRPDYRRIVELVDALPANAPVLATTATANARVERDIAEQLGNELETMRGRLARENLRLQVLPVAADGERLAWIAQYVRDAAGSGIIYANTTHQADRVSAWLSSQGVAAPAYHAQLDPGMRPVLEERLARNEVHALVATVALGMGYDKPDLAFVVHYERPASAIAYYQQAGRAGRGIDAAEAVLLCGREDDRLAERRIASAFPANGELAAVLRALQESGRMRFARLAEEADLEDDDLERALRLLIAGGAVRRAGTRYQATGSGWRSDPDRIARVTLERTRELAQMQEYVRTERCLMVFLTRELGERGGRACGQCSNCAGSFVPERADPRLRRAADEWLALEARKSERATGSDWPPPEPDDD